MVRIIVRLSQSSIRRPASRSLSLLVLVLAAASAWFGLVPLPVQPGRGIAAAAAPGATEPSSLHPTTGAGPTPIATATLAPTPASDALATTRPPVSPTPASSQALVEFPDTPPPSATAAVRTALSLRLDSLRATYGLPGISAAILFADGSIWRGTSGLANIAAGRPVTPGTEFAVASVSKTFLGALILALAEDDRLDLETPVTHYLPKLAINRSITVHQLLDHTSGLHDYFYGRGIDKALMADRKRIWTAARALGFMGKPYFKPGTGWHYSNTNYLILGMLAEAVGRAPLAQQLHSRFLGPLGLRHTYYQGVDRRVGPVARAYRFNGPAPDAPPIPLSDGTDVVPFTSVVTAAGSAGSIASTAQDLVTWARALYGGHVLAPATLAAMVADVEVTAPFKPSIPYGLGVQAATIDGRPTLGHSGRLLGERSVMRWLPDERIAIAVLTNQSRTDPNLVVQALLRDVLGVPPGCTGCEAPN
jgi:CubicO group peptidase (beta-lactamase class C family)